VKILVINPVGTDRWDRGDQEYLSRQAPPTDVIDVLSLPDGPLSVETPVAEARAERGVLELVGRVGSGYDSIMVNCFAEPGVMASREIVDVPVVGPCQASLAVASQLGERFCIVSPRSDHGNMVLRRARVLGFEARIAASEGIGIPVLDLDAHKETTVRAIAEAARRGLDRGADVVILGCTGMACVIDEVRKALPVPVVEPMAAGFTVARALAGLKLRTSRQGLYMKAPLSKQTGGHAQ